MGSHSLNRERAISSTKQVSPPVRHSLLQRRYTSGKQEADLHHAALSPGIKDALEASGQPLDTGTRAFMEPRFGHDFSKVRVHTDQRAADSAQAMNALAYTVGEKVVFGAGQYTPESKVGQRLLVHELAHVVQQSRGGPRPVLNPTADHEHDAEAVASAIVAGHSHVTVRGATSVGLARAGTQSGSPLVMPKEVIEMPWVGKGKGISSSEQGYLRDAQYFWSEYTSRWPEQLSPINQTRIRNQESPLVDDTWLQFHPEHTAYNGETLEHHHVGQGSRTVALPETLHDAYTTFHPQRQVVKAGEGSKPLRPLKPQPTAQHTEEEIARHVKAGRIRGPGIDPNKPPKAPSVPLSSEVSTLPPEQLRPVDPVTGKVIGKPSVEPPATPEAPVPSQPPMEEVVAHEPPLAGAKPPVTSPAPPAPPKVPVPSQAAAGKVIASEPPNVEGLPPVKPPAVPEEGFAGPVGSIAGGLALLGLGLLASKIQANYEKPFIERDLRALEPEIRRQLSTHQSEILTLGQKSPGKVYANITVELIYPQQCIAQGCQQGYYKARLKAVNITLENINREEMQDTETHFLTVFYLYP